MKKDPNPITRIGLTRDIVRELGPEKAADLARQLARFQLGLLHPDRGGDEEAFLEVNEAREELASPRKAEGWARVLIQEGSYDRAIREEREKVAQAERRLEARVERYMRFLEAGPIDKGTVKVRAGRKRRTLTVEGMRIVPPPTLPGHRVVRAGVVGTITSPPAPFAEDLADEFAGDLADGCPSFAVMSESGAYTPVSFAIIEHLEFCIRPYDPGREATLVSLYSVGPPEGRHNEPTRPLWRFEGAVVDWTGLPLPAGTTLPAGPRLTGPEVIKQLPTDKSLLDMVFACIKAEYSHLLKRYWDEFLSYAIERLYTSKLKGYIPEKGPLPSFLRRFAKYQRLHFLRDVVAKNFRTRDPALLEKILDRGLGPLDTVLREEVRDEVGLWIAQLRKSHRVAAEMFFLQGRGYEEIGAKLDLSFSQAKNMVDTARDKLRELFIPLRPG
jgi:RNA polymerase sigma factor (sigma-70 family)